MRWLCIAASLLIAAGLVGVGTPAMAQSLFGGEDGQSGGPETPPETPPENGNGSGGPDGPDGDTGNGDMLADSPFDESLLASAVALEVANSGWDVRQVVITAHAQVGTPDDPRYEVRFSAEVALRADTYAIDLQDGQFTLVIPVSEAGTAKELLGAADAQPAGDGWDIDLNLQNLDVLDGSGMPLSAMSGQVIVRGSAEEQFYLERIESERQQEHALEMATLARDAEVAAAREEMEQQAAAAALAAIAREEEEEAARDAARLADLEREEAIISAEAAQAQARANELAAAQAALQEQEAALADMLASAAAQRDEVLAAVAELEAQESALAGTLAELQTSVSVLQDQFLAGLEDDDRLVQMMAVELAMASDDPSLISLGFEAALSSGDPALHTSALRHYFEMRDALPVMLYPTEQDPEGTQAFIDSISPVVLTWNSIDTATGDLLGAFDLAWSCPNENFCTFKAGQIAQSSLIASSERCRLELSLTENRTLDGVMDCIDFPPTIARIVLE